jgi:phosphoribosylformylglycinamidine synthase subunit PurL
VLETGDVLAMQDLGAAGLTSSAVEMAARGGLGVEIDVARVPRRETGLSPFEVMLSESQERMLLLVRHGTERAVSTQFARWELHAQVIGQVTDDGLIRVLDEGVAVAELPIALLTDEVPAYELRPEPPAAAPLMVGEPSYSSDEIGVNGSRGAGAETLSVAERLLELLASPNLRSRRFAFRQYDSTVQGNTVFGPGGGAAAVVRVDGTRKGLAFTTDCNPRYMRLDPRRGAMQAVAEAARNLACVGAEPIAVTDCLNFGNPEKPAVAWQLTEAIHGLAEACRALGIPVVSGNVSLYNESAGSAIPPTPTVGMVGLLQDVGLAVPAGFTADSAVVLLGEPAAQPLDDHVFPRFSLEAEQRLADLLRALAERRLVRSAQDVADGGLGVALAECALIGGVGAQLSLSADQDPWTALFSEDQARAVVTCGVEKMEAVVRLAAAYGVPATQAGATGGDRLDVDGALSLALADLREAWEGSQ